MIPYQVLLLQMKFVADIHLKTSNVLRYFEHVATCLPPQSRRWFEQGPYAAYDDGPRELLNLVHGHQPRGPETLSHIVQEGNIPTNRVLAGACC